MSDRAPIPRDPGNDYTPEMAERRAEFLREKTGAALNHVRRASFDPAVLPGNIEIGLQVAELGLEEMVSGVTRFRPGGRGKHNQKRDEQLSHAVSLDVFRDYLPARPLLLEM